MAKKVKRSPDMNQLAKSIVEIATGQSKTQMKDTENVVVKKNRSKKI
jgi:hypothetical protein